MRECKDDLTRLLEMIRKLNARAEYARLAQVMLGEMMPRIKAEDLAEQLKKNNKTQLFRELIEACEVYS